jgi:hypothetical protein
MAEAEQFLSEGLNRRPYLTELPEEILTDIFAYVAIQKTTNPWPSRCLAGNYSARPLIYVCHRFYRLAIPLLYVNFAAATTDLEFVPPSDVVTSLHRTLVARPDFRRYCTTLSIYIPDVDARESTALDWKNAHEVITLLPNVQSLSLEGGFERYPTENWRLLRHATQCMEKLHSLTLSRECFNLSLMTFMRQEVDFAKLKSLTVNGFSNGWPTTESELVLEPVCSIHGFHSHWEEANSIIEPNRSKQPHFPPTLGLLSPGHGVTSTPPLASSITALFIHE